MRALIPLVGLLVLAACSDTSPGNQTDGSAAAIEKQIEGDAKSLEAAADEAVNVLHSSVEKKLQDDGILKPLGTIPQIAAEQEQVTQP